MSDKVRPVIAVVAAEVNCIEQRQILSGVAAQAQENGVDVAVISNIFNANTDDDKNFHENGIYDLMLSEDIDGLIFISESFVSNDLKERIRQLLVKRRDLPMIAVGTKLSELSGLPLRYINTDDQRDIEEITDHLIEVHGFTDIDMITGPDNIEVSNIRVRGYRRSLEKHGIDYAPDKVHIGNFWMNSGEQLAEKYINGELPMPQAVICSNDYMAYGMLDMLMEHGVKVPDDLTVVGYEYVWERIYHTPLLTTYQRNRSELGRRAVQIIFSQITGEVCKPFSPPRGKLICGYSCPCRCHSQEYMSELKATQNASMYAEWNINSPMDRQLTNCSSVDEFAGVMGSNSFLVRYVQDMYLCLSEKWYDDEAADHDVISCRSVLPWLDNSVILLNKLNFSRIFARSPKSAIYYFSPLFFGSKTFGYTILKYDNPDTYDVIYKNWVKSLCNALEFMRMKNDIRYFNAYDDLSEQYDTLTGIYNEKGFENAVKYAVSNAGAGKKLLLILLRVIPPDDSLDILDTRLSVSTEIADCLRLISGNPADLSGRVERNMYGFAAVGDFGDGFAELLCDKLRLLVTYRTSCVSEWGVQSVITSVRQYDADGFDYRTAFGAMKEEIAETEKRYAASKLTTGYQKFLECRTRLCLEPYEEHTISRICQDFGLSEGHFRKLYRDHFGSSFHHDLLSFKTSYAKYLLCTTSLDINTVSTKCGYIDTKYFLRIFRKITGFTAKQYRDIFK